MQSCHCLCVVFVLFLSLLTESIFQTFQAISQPQNFTIGVEVKDDGIIVESFSSKGYQYTKSKSLSAVFNCTVIVSGTKQVSLLYIYLFLHDP